MMNDRLGSLRGLRKTSILMIATCASVVLGGRSALAVVRSCGPDPVANTANVLCSAPSGPCNASIVTLGVDVDVVDAGCTFDLGGRPLSVQKSLQMTGLGFIQVVNAGDITITGSGRLKARGDFVEPNGVIVSGGTISLASAGTITLLNNSQIDVSGDASGTIRLVATGRNAAGVGVNLQAGSILRGHGISSSVDEGERFADGGSLEITATTGGVVDNAAIDMGGANQASGGALAIQAARDIAIGEVADVSGGGSDGGIVDLLAADNITITKTVTVDSRLGGGSGGSITIEAGADAIGGGIVLGGSLTVSTSLLLNGSSSDTFGGDGGDLDASAGGPMTFTATSMIKADAGSIFDGSGGTITLDSSDLAPNVLGPLDSDLNLAGRVTANSGSLSGDGGLIDIIAGRNLAVTAVIDASGKDTGGDVTGDAGGSVLLGGSIRAVATTAAGTGGFIEFTAGRASNAGLTVADDILAAGGLSNGSGQIISLAGCTLTVNTGVDVDGQAGVDVNGVRGGSDITLTSRGVMRLNASSRYLAGPAGRVFTIHAPGQNPVIGSGVVFSPTRIDTPTLVGLPNCPVCGDGVRQAGEGCDDGDLAGGDGCSATCTVETGWTCTGDQPSVCTAVVGCGDGHIQGSERCDDGNLVNGDGCDSNCTPTGCGNGLVTAGEQCDDGNAQAGDCCSATCQFEGAGSTCTSDGSVCTDDRCNATGTCQHLILTGPCDDGNACTQTDTCQAGICTGTNPVVCAALDQCHDVGTCAPATGLCSNPAKANGSACTDANACTRTDTCQAGACAGTNPVVCTALDQCHVVGTCAPATGVCSNPSKTDGTTCNDANACTRTDTCQAGACAGGNPVVCTALDQCHVPGTCAPATGLCTNPLQSNGTPCQDGNQCTITDACSDGVCRGDAQICGDGTIEGSCGEVCDDGNRVDGDGCDSNCMPTGCGNGIVTAGEECDDHDLTGGDGCSATCALESGWSCTGQPSVCSEVCGNGVRTPGEQCDDGNLVSRDGCSSSCTLELCGTAPAGGCRRPALSGKAAITLKVQALPEKNGLDWKWIKGTATSKLEFGNPLSTTSYAVCLYDTPSGTPRLVLSATALAGGVCSGRSCWREKTDGFGYADKALTPDGIAKIAMKAGVSGATKITLKGKGQNLALQNPAELVAPVVVQLRNSDGGCWEAIYSAPATKQTSALFKDKAD